MARPGDKTRHLIETLPPKYDKRDTANVVKLLGVFGESINELGGALDPAVAYTAYQKARLSVLLGWSEGVYLDRIGANFGIGRHPLLGANDEPYRQLIGALAWLPKAINFSIQTLLEILLGKQADLVLAGKRPWRVYEFTNTIVIEVPFELTRASNENASYLHGISGVGFSDPMTAQPEFYVADRDLTQDWQDVITGFTLSILIAGAWSNFVASSMAFSAGITTITTTTNVPSGLVGVPFFLVTKGYRGDFLTPDHNERADTSTTPPHADRVYLSGDGILEVVKYYMLRIVRASGIVVRYKRI